MGFPHLRSLFSRAVSKKYQGQLFAVLSALELLSTGISPLVLNNVYRKTVDVYPGAVWLLMAGILVLANMILLCVWRNARQTENEDQITGLLQDSDGEINSHP